MEASSLNLRHLRAMLAIVRRGSVKAAAREVNLTQPAITQALRKLEAQLGQALFERRSDGMTATPAAHILAARVEKAQALLGKAHLTAAQVRAVLAVAKAGSYAGATRDTGLSEAALHRAVADLSIAAGTAVFERHRGGMLTTSRGERLVRRLRLAQAELSAGLDELAAEQGRETGRIAIGAMPLSRARLLPAALGRFIKVYPEFTVEVAEGSYAELLAPLRDGELDLLIGALRDPLASRELRQTPLLEDRPVVIGRIGHPLAGASPDLADMARYPWVVAGRGTPLHDQWRDMFDKASVPRPRVPIECGSVMTIRQLLIDSDFLTLLSLDQVSVELEARWLAVVAPAPPATVRRIGITTRADWTPTPLQRVFVAELHSAAGRLPS